MAAQLFTLPRQIAISSSFAALPGAKLYFFLSGTSTPQDTYQDADLDAEHENPVEADNNGLFEEIYLDPAISYKCELRTAGDVLLYTSDPCNSAFPSSGQVNIATSVAGTNTITAALVPAITVYTPEMTLVLTPVATNTTAVTIDVGAGALPAQYLDGTALSGSEMLIDRPALFNLNKAGTAWVLQNPAVGRSRGLEVGYRGLPFRVVSGNSNSVATDAGGDIVYTGGGGHTFTLDTDLGGSSSVLAVCQIRNASASTLALTTAATLQWYSGAGLSTGARTLASGAVVTVLSDGTNFIVYGMGIS